jgi:MFS family permease
MAVFNPVFHSRGFRRLWLSVALSASSASADFVLVGWLALEASGSPAWVGLAFALYYVPMLVLGVPAGSLADRFDRYRLIRGLELAAAALLAGFALLFRLLEPGLVLALVLPLVLGGLRALQSTVRLSFAYDLVGPENLTPALAGTSVGTRLGMIVGALAAGAVAQRYGAAPAFVLMAASHVAAWAVLGGRMQAASAQKPDPAPLLRSLRDSAAEVARNRLLLALIVVTAVVEVFGVSFLTLVPSLAQDRLQLGADGMGWMQAVQSAGGLLAGLAMFALPPLCRNAAAYTASILCLGLAVMALGVADGLAAHLIALATISAAIAVWDILTQSMMQRSVPDHLRGRAMGAWVFAIGSAPLGHLQIGLLAAGLGPTDALLLNGACVVGAIVVALLVSPSLRRL